MSKSPQKKVTPFPTPQMMVLSGEIPYSQEAEEAVIGSVLVNPEAFIDVASFLKAEDFYILRHTLIWQALQRLREQGDEIDYLTVQEALKAMGKLAEVGGPAYLAQLMNSMPTSMHAEVYGRIVEAAALRRRLMAAADEIKHLAVDFELSAHAVADKAEAQILEITTQQTSRGVVSIREGLAEYWEHIQANKETYDGDLLGIPTGFKALDKVWGGLRRGKVYLSTGVSGHAKTDTTLNIIFNAASLGARVLFFSLDMAYKVSINKLLSIATGIPHARIESGRLSKAEWEKYGRAQRALETYSLWIHEKELGLDREPWDRIMSVSESIARRYGLDLIAIDYTMLISSGGRYKAGDYNDKIYGVMNLPVLAQKFNVPVLGLHQMNKRRITSEAQRPDDQEFLEYGGENAADAIIAWYKKSKVAGYENTDRTKLEGIVLKNRFGPDNVTLRFKHDGPTAKVRDWPKALRPESDDPDSVTPRSPTPHYLDELDDRAYGEEDEGE